MFTQRKSNENKAEIFENTFPIIYRNRTIFANLGVSHRSVVANIVVSEFKL